MDGTETVLLAEDEAAVRAVARQALQRHGYTVLEAQSGEAALDLAQRHSGRIHLLLTDVIMPGMSGRALALRLVPMRPDVRIIYMSGYTDDAITRHGVLEPGVTYVQKPFTPDALVRKVREVLDGTDLRGWEPNGAERRSYLWSSRSLTRARTSSCVHGLYSSGTPASGGRLPRSSPGEYPLANRKGVVFPSRRTASNKPYAQPRHHQVR
jgi:CheY-like chemotaxis protein